MCSASQPCLWFTGAPALTMAEIPYPTPVIGAAAFADCPHCGRFSSIQRSFYH
jgi:hypothetical protein